MLLYGTWKHRNDPEEQQDVLDDAFSRVASETDARFVPVGAAWQLARARHPEIELYAEDGGHASPAGTYLAACVFCAVLTPAGEKPPAPPARITVGGVTLVDLPEGQAYALQMTAQETIGKRSQECSFCS